MARPAPHLRGIRSARPRRAGVSVIVVAALAAAALGACGGSSGGGKTASSG
jgi:hypothetical protein